MTCWQVLTRVQPPLCTTGGERRDISHMAKMHLLHKNTPLKKMHLLHNNSPLNKKYTSKWKAAITKIHLSIKNAPLSENQLFWRESPPILQDQRSVLWCWILEHHIYGQATSLWIHSLFWCHFERMFPQQCFARIPGIQCICALEHQSDLAPSTPTGCYQELYAVG